MLQSKWITTAVPHPQSGEVSYHSRLGRSVIGVRPSVPSRWASPRALLTPGLSAQLGKGLPPFLARRAGRVTRRPPVWSPLTHGPHPTTPLPAHQRAVPLWTAAHFRMDAFVGVLRRGLVGVRIICIIRGLCSTSTGVSSASYAGLAVPGARALCPGSCIFHTVLRRGLVGVRIICISGHHVEAPHARRARSAMPLVRGNASEEFPSSTPKAKGWRCRESQRSAAHAGVCGPSGLVRATQ